MSGSAKGGRRPGGTIVIRREEVVEGGHHGGAWKVAYADFVTAMMAFFLLMWLLNATTEEQRRGLADFFSPSNALGRSMSGSGGLFGGTTPNSEGNVTSDRGAVRPDPGRAPIQDVEEDDSDSPARPVPRREAAPGEVEADPGGAAGRATEQAGTGQVGAGQTGANQAGANQAGAARGAAVGTWETVGGGPAPAQAAFAPSAVERTQLTQASEAGLRAELARREQAAFEQAAEQLRAAVRDDPALADLSRQLLIEQTPEGLRIQVLDSERQPMFTVGGTAPNERARALIGRVAQVLTRLPNAVAIGGHTDATPFRGTERSNWDLSAERANATRRLLLEGGVTAARVRTVAGHAEREPLLPEQPTAAANRRVSVLVLRQAPPPEPAPVTANATGGRAR